MRIDSLLTNPQKYSSNTYLIRGDFNSLNDKNSLIDTGADDYIIDEIEKINTGAGKKRVEQVILTHNHFDHTGGLKYIKDQYNPLVFAFSEAQYVDRILKNGDIIKLGDKNFEIIYCPEHSNDSICLYSWEDKILFSGDVNIAIINQGGEYSKGFMKTIEKLIFLGVEKIFPGHGKPILNGTEVLERTLKIIKNE